MLSDAEMLAVGDLKHQFHPDAPPRFAVLMREEIARRVERSTPRSRLQFEHLTVGLQVIDLQTQREMRIIDLYSEQRVAVCTWTDSQGFQVEQPFLPEVLELAGRPRLELL